VFSLAESVTSAQERTGIPEVAAALHVDGKTELAGAAERPFRIASITKSFTATLLWETGRVDERTRALLSHTAGYRPESTDSLPPECAGLWSYSNAGYREAGAVLADYSAALRDHVLEPLGLERTGFETPPEAVLGTLPDGSTADPAYPVPRRPIGGLWSTVADLVTYGLAHCRGYAELHEPVAEALGASYACGWWVRDGGILDHEGSVGGFQSLLLLVPGRELVLAVLTNSWNGSGLIRHIVDDLGVVPASDTSSQAPVEGTYALDDFEAVVAGRRITERETDPVTGTRIERRYPFSANATLMTWRTDFPRDGVARIGWTALPRVGAGSVGGKAADARRANRVTFGDAR
jgi:CubicO group peptidase (beta-lactamase class C family)